MKMTRAGLVSAVMVLFLGPMLYGQDLSKYRNFSFGMSLADISKQIDKTPADATPIHERPALIQELAWWPTMFGSPNTESAREILFSFYNGALYRIDITYDDTVTKGLTAEDMAHALSVDYGAFTAPVASINFPTNVYASTEKVLDRWENSLYSVNLYRSSLSDTFALAMFAKQVNTDAEAAIVQSAKLDQREAPQKEIDRAKKATDDLETTRQQNIKAFHP